VTVVDAATSRAAYQPNRYGLYHMSGNAAEWTHLSPIWQRQSLRGR
jgi:formylglycine-generating enzyme required for sulfatase activity